MLRIYITVLALTFWQTAISDTLVQAENNNLENRTGQYGEFILTALYKDIGLEYSRPERKSEKNNNKNDIWNEDDFFNDDIDFENGSFNDISEGFEKEFNDTTQAWNEEFEKTVKRWNEQKEIYTKEIDKYAETTVNLEQTLSGSVNQIPESVTSDAMFKIDNLKPGDLHFIPYSLDNPIRDQKRRGTCAAFAGIRAIESILNQNDEIRRQKFDLSEQHFYWISKPDCNTTACTKNSNSEGSNFDLGFYRSTIDNTESAIRLESSCPYIPYKNDNNFTYTPLTSCLKYKGFFRAKQVFRNLTVDRVIDELANNRPVAAGIYLPKSFYTAGGLLQLEDPDSKLKGTDQHAGGHAILFVGFIKLPEKFWSAEGDYCLITANSWGVGWGVGGHTCITKKWFEANVIRNKTDNNRGSILTSVQAIGIDS
ncbi:C1 family peptidase [Halioxenophilus sp. WMMB6]|uniref:C1 family peptidase n=1 Tax=Halioxenophilus sp. WMMB6 TaxID=3073815 RepID=UPI00295F58AE|nr:C1 family peptidase [Halioxenophilus sp. WMMB6]